jgi:hypothetical protein
MPSRSPAGDELSPRSCFDHHRRPTEARSSPAGGREPTGDSPTKSNDYWLIANCPVSVRPDHAAAVGQGQINALVAALR